MAKNLRSLLRLIRPAKRGGPAPQRPGKEDSAPMSQTETPAQAITSADAPAAEAVRRMTRRAPQEALRLRRRRRLTGYVLSDGTAHQVAAAYPSSSSAQDSPKAGAEQQQVAHRAPRGQEVEASAVRMPAYGPDLLVLDDLASAFDGKIEQAPKEHPPPTTIGTPLQTSGREIGEGQPQPNRGYAGALAERRAVPMPPGVVGGAPRRLRARGRDGAGPPAGLHHVGPAPGRLLPRPPEGR